MEDEFQKRTVLCYSNFMNYIISFSIFNIIILIIENSSIIYSVDLMMDGDKVLNELFTPFYFLSPHLYIEMLNEKFPNQCFQIFDFNTIMLEYEEANKQKEDDDDKDKENTNDNNLESSVDSTQTLRNLDEKIINNRKKKRLKKETNKLKYKWKKRRIDNEGNNENTTEKIELQEDESEEEEEDEEDEDPMVAMYKRITEERYYDIKFKGKTLYSLDTSYCV